MPRYIIERDVGSVSLEDLQAVGRKSNQVLDDMEGVVWIRSYVSDAEGKIYCEYEAPSPEAIMEHAKWPYPGSNNTRAPTVRGSHPACRAGEGRQRE